MTTETTVTNNLVYAYLEPRHAHPRFGEIRYVGSSSVGLKRVLNFKNHYHGLVGNWLKACGGSVPWIILAEFAKELPYDDLLLEENKYITFYKALDCADKNLMEQGRGGKALRRDQSEDVGFAEGQKDAPPY